MGVLGEGGFTSKVEGAVDAHCRLLLELSQALRGSFVHHQVQGLVEHHQLHAVKLPIIHGLHAGQERRGDRGSLSAFEAGLWAVHVTGMACISFDFLLAIIFNLPEVARIEAAQRTPRRAMDSPMHPSFFILDLICLTIQLHTRVHLRTALRTRT